MESILQALNEARKNEELIRIEQCYLEKTEVKSYRFKTSFPNGLKRHSVAAWFSTDYKKDGLYMSSKELATYIANVNSDRGGEGISYVVTRVQIEAE